ncbi:hypothetical protein H4W31_001252 [Plantactinospora soyae]|uniref:Uncharacterized protein n=1 Tax=Plantactinospora soyae TaxID=1544732 RepID=A0A927M105_9ACTN|nr:hypothetical protein [Plantactinospora soyae]
MQDPFNVTRIADMRAAIRETPLNGEQSDLAHRALAWP